MTKILVTVQENKRARRIQRVQRPKMTLLRLQRIKATKVSWLKIRKGRRPGCHTFLKQSVVSLKVILQT